MDNLGKGTFGMYPSLSVPTGHKMKIPTEDDINEDALDKDFQQLELECKVEGQRPKLKQESCEEELDVSYTCSHRRLSKCLYVSMFAYDRV